MLSVELENYIKDDGTERAFEILERDASEGEFVDVFGSSNRLFFYLIEENKYNTLLKLLEYYNKYFLNIYEIETKKYAEVYQELEEAICNASEGEDLSPEMLYVIGTYLKTHLDSSTESAIDNDDRGILSFEEEGCDKISEHIGKEEKIEDKFMNVFSPESQEVLSMIGCEG